MWRFTTSSVGSWRCMWASAAERRAYTLAGVVTALHAALVTAGEMGGASDMRAERVVCPEAFCTDPVSPGFREAWGSH